jgi:homoserine dehydrogenase
MGKGINIITPNKKLGSGPLERYQAVRRMQRESYIHFFYEVRGDGCWGGLRLLICATSRGMS